MIQTFDSNQAWNFWRLMTGSFGRYILVLMRVTLETKDVEILVGQLACRQ